MVTVIIHGAGDMRLVPQGVAVGYMRLCESPGGWETDHTPYRESLGIEVI